MFSYLKLKKKHTSLVSKTDFFVFFCRSLVLDERKNKQPKMAITNFEELGKLKAGSRLPINIYKCTSDTINFTSYIENNKNMTTTTTAIQIHDTQSETNSTYYSYLNKLYTNNSSLSINSVGSSVSSISSSSISTTTTTNNSSDYDTSDAEIKYMKSVCKKLLSKQQAAVRSTRTTTMRQSSTSNTKLLTILFDYEDATENFRVKQGDNVELLKAILDDDDVDGQFKYVVRKSLDGSIGSIPIDYTIDLNDIKQMVRFNKKKNHVKLTKL
jgi:hypothetical protein